MDSVACTNALGSCFGTEEAEQPRPSVEACGACQDHGMPHTFISTSSWSCELDDRHNAQLVNMMSACCFALSPQPQVRTPLPSWPSVLHRWRAGGLIVAFVRATSPIHSAWNHIRPRRARQPGKCMHPSARIGHSLAWPARRCCVADSPVSSCQRSERGGCGVASNQDTATTNP